MAISTLILPSVCIFTSTIVLHFFTTYTVAFSLGNANAATLSAKGDSNMPKGWSSMCKTVPMVKHNRTNITISCHVTLRDSWDFNDFRNWSAGLEDNILLILNIVCDAEGSVCLPWPYRAAHLDTLKVRGCVNVCFWADYSRPEVIEMIPDTLRVFEGYNVITKSSVRTYLSVSLKNLSPALNCGPLLIEIYIYSGTINIFTSPEEDLSDEILDTLNRNDQDMKNVKHICRYENMKVFDISKKVDNSISYLHEKIANSRFPQLRTLNISQTELKTIPAVLSIWKRRFERLEMLDLTFNNITQFDLRDFSLSSRRVVTIDLKNNNIRTMGDLEIQSLTTVEKAVIDVRGNPFECNCAMTNFTHYLQQLKNPKDGGLHKNYSYLWDLTCVSPPRFRGRRIAELTKDLLCSTDFTSYVAQITVLSIVVALLMIVIILLARYWNEIRILSFTRLHIFLPCQSVEAVCNKVYDAFVAYSHLDTTWVMETLLPRLENDTGGVGGNFRLCLHQRDFEVGAAIADNIMQSVEASRHTILVLSKNFLESEWCLMEFRTAFHQSLIERKKHLILVLLEDIPSQDLDPDLRRCMQMWTYIHISDRLFWDRIVYSLTDKSQSRFKLCRRQKHKQMQMNRR